MNILITHAYSNDNKGDAALLSVLISDIRRAFGKANITVLTLDPAIDLEGFEGATMKHSFMYFARGKFASFWLRLPYAAFVAVSTVVWAFMYRLAKINLPLPGELKEIAELYRDADLIIPVGGGYIRAKDGIMDTYVLFFILHPIVLARILGKVTVGYSQSVGPFGNKLQEIMAKYAVKKMDGIISRENITSNLLEKWGIKNAITSPDSGFLHASDKESAIRQELNIPPNTMLVGITVRSWLERPQQAAYEHAVAELGDYILKKHNAAIVFVPQVTAAHYHDDDRIVAKEIYTLMHEKKNAHVLTARYDHKEIKAIYSKLDVLVGTRFHSVIFSLTSGVPAIAIGYEYKTIGIMTDLGLQSWVIDFDSVNSEKLISMFDRLVGERSQYKNHLAQVLPPYVTRAEQSIKFVKDIYDKKHEK